MQFSSFESLLKKIPKLNSNKLDINQYLAHTASLEDKERLQKEDEPLPDHIDLVNKTALKIIQIHGLEPLIEKLITELCSQLELEGKTDVGNFLKEVFVATFVFHDYGKINENFQVEKMNNPFFQSVESPIGSGHSVLSGYLFMNHYILKAVGLFEDKISLEIARIITDFSDPIFKHHSSTLRIKNIDDSSISQELKRFLPFVNLSEPFAQMANILKDKKGFQQDLFQNKEKGDLEDYPLFSLIKLNFSILTAADYLATLSYQNNVKLPKPKDKNWWGVLSDERKTELITDFINSTPYNKVALTNPEGLTLKPIETYEKQDEKNLNHLRSYILGDVVQNLRENKDERLFYLSAPTGAGKTNISLAVALDMLSMNAELNKIFYVFPFTTLITQTFDDLKKALNLTSQDIIELHSKAEWSRKNTEEKKDGLYSADWENHVENMFVNYPITLLSHIKFFDVLKGNNKESNYLIHRLANSVVILDELQSYNPNFWEHINYFIEHYSKNFNIQFVVMSATLPKIDRLTIKSDQHWVELLPNSKRFFQNKNFSGRITFDFDLMENEELDIQFLYEFVYEKSEAYANRNNGNVKAVIEFIKKKTASEFYQLCKESDGIFDDYTIILLSGTILNPRRREIVDHLKSEEWLKSHEKVLVISTQVVEAGVNIDMDIGFKDSSIIDSDEQLAGRVNRNMKKKNSKVYLFNLDREDNIYRGDLRIKFQREEIDLEEHKNILTEKDFDRLYDRVISYRLKNRKGMFRTFEEYLSHLEKLRFQRANDGFKLIEDSSGSVFIPLSIPEDRFADFEIDLLDELNIDSNLEGYSGAEIFNAFKDIVLNKKQSFIAYRDNIRKLQSIISKFTISLFKTSIDQIERIEKDEGVEEPYKFGYLYFSNYPNFYSYEEGLLLPENYEPKNDAFTF